MISIYSLTFNEMQKKIIDLGLPKFNAISIYKWIYQKKINNFDKFTDISKNNIEILKKNFYFPNFEIVNTINCDDKTIKFLFKLEDGNYIEAVLMYFEFGKSICISSQVGCAMGCKFCASGLFKKKRNLTPDEYILQYLKISEYLSKTNDTISNISFMGIGEPFDNYDNLLKAIKIFNERNGICLGMRNLIVSTCGIVPKIIQFAKDCEQVKLAISLHASNDKVRNKIMPINYRWNISELMNAAKKYVSITKKQITFEYVLLKGVNDSKEFAIELSKLITGINCYVNLLVYNKVKENDFKQSNNTKLFANELTKRNVIVAVRTPKGKNVDAGCGQLRSDFENNNT